MAKCAFTNGDIVALLSAISVSGNENEREIFYQIITSKCPTSMTKYKLYDKAQQIAQRLSGTSRRSRRQDNKTVVDDNQFASKMFRVPSRKSKRTVLQPIEPSKIQMLRQDQKTAKKKRRVKRRFTLPRQLKHTRKCTKKRSAPFTSSTTTPPSKSIRFDGKVRVCLHMCNDVMCMFLLFFFYFL